MAYFLEARVLRRELETTVVDRNLPVDPFAR